MQSESAAHLVLHAEAEAHTKELGQVLPGNGEQVCELSHALGVRVEPEQDAVSHDVPTVG